MAPLLPLLLLLLVAASAAPGPAPDRLPVTPPPPQQDGFHFTNNQHLNNIVDALIGSGDFSDWASILSLPDPAIFPLSATIFVPYEDVSLLMIPQQHSFDPYKLPYHIVPQRLAFSDLLLFRPFSRLPTLLPFSSIVITNNSASNFTINSVPLSRPDLYTTASIVVHGIDSVLDYSADGSTNAHGSAALPPPPPPPPRPGNFVLDGQLVFQAPPGSTSDAHCLISHAEMLVIVLMVLEVVFLLIDSFLGLTYDFI